MNEVIIIGRLTKDPAMKYTQNGTEIAEFVVAESRFGAEKTNFHRCVAFHRTATLIEQFCKKGNLVCVVGNISQSSYTKETEHGDRVQMNMTDIQVNRIEFLSEKRRDSTSTATPEEYGSVKNRNGEAFSAADLYAAENNEVPKDTTLPQEFEEIDENVPF